MMDNGYMSECTDGIDQHSYISEGKMFFDWLSIHQHCSNVFIKPRLPEISDVIDLERERERKRYKVSLAI